MMIGETGSGKSTLINAMINYIMGVKSEDDVKVKLIEEKGKATASKTSCIHVYKINHLEGFHIPYSLTIIDTPGFAHTEGIEKDKETVQQIKDCFTSPHGINEIDAVCFVVKASDERLTPVQRYVFDAILGLFGKDIEKNIIFCVTHCDSGIPKVLASVSELSVPCAKDIYGNAIYFEFNNSDSSLNTSEAKDNINLGTKSVILTREVLKEREALQIVLECLVQSIEEVMLKTHEKERIVNILKQHGADIERNGHFEYEEKETRKKKIETETDATNCSECDSTCHHPCLVPHDAFIYFCEIFYWNSTCRICEHNKSSHRREKFKWQKEVVTVKKSYAELKQKYEKAQSEKMSVEMICEKLNSERQEAELKGIRLTEKARDCLQRLREIALKPDPLSTADYINLLIINEKSNRKPGFTERISSLENLQNQMTIRKGLESVPVTAAGEI
ncbi:hypothetical protein XENTR_v90027103mg [Pelobates cultripes]|uniref:AIG1-type G domain-containing protein n=1 Tax=Pelobates cultripes TaxID=61616 RepID=A0AAD1W2M4_PELCU|nr:hypothetical protein XENTR_v90027103mg [Pelobates cultripes]